MSKSQNNKMQRNPEHMLNAPRSLTYAQVGVDTSSEETGLARLVHWVNRTHALRAGVGAPKLAIGYFANVVDIGHNLGLAITTDGVGTKVLIAQMMGKYDTIGIDCVATNVNDLICVGAEPLTLVDCLSVERSNPDVLAEIGKGLYEGARKATVTIVGGEIAQVRDLVKGHRPGIGLDLTATCVGLVPLHQIVDGADVEEGDVVIGLRSSGVHSNGLSLAREALLGSGRYGIDQYIPELGRVLGDELLEPTEIYVADFLSLRQASVSFKALANITSDGFLNLTRVRADVGYVIERLPDPQPIFGLIQNAGNVSDAEMFRIFNMGIGFCIIVSPAETSRAMEILARQGREAHIIGHAVSDPKRRVAIEPYRLIGEGDRFLDIKRTPSR